MSAAPQPQRIPAAQDPALLEWARRPKASALPRFAGGLVLLAADFSVVFACYLAGYQLRVHGLARLPGLQVRGEPIGYEAYLFFVPIYLLVFALAGLYARRASALEESVAVLRACAYATAGAMIVASAAHIAQLFSRTAIAVSALLTAMAMPAARYAVKCALGRWRNWQRPIVLLGANANGIRAARDLAADRTAGYRVVGIFADHAIDSRLPWPVWRMEREAAIRFCRAYGFRSFILCEDSGDRGALLGWFRMLEDFADEIKVATADLSLHSWRIQSEVLKSSYLLGYQNPLGYAANRVLKRLLDVGGGALLCVLFAPALIVIPLLILATSGRPILFRQVRLGRDGKRFHCLKFRTMHRDAEQRLHSILVEDESVGREFAATFKLRHDPRVTRLGAWLRHTSLDELPQLWNVLRGQMSLVGPRPIVPEETGRYDLDLTNYFRVPCGLTGLWQISGRSDLSYAERIRLDLFYIRNWSIWLDLVILARTAAYLLRPRGAY